jgi:homoserine kinase type II
MAVYTKINDLELRHFLSQYNIGELITFSEIAEGVENSNFLVQTTKGPFILTLYEKRVDPGDLPFFSRTIDTSF